MQVSVKVMCMSSLGRNNVVELYSMVSSLLFNISSSWLDLIIMFHKAICLSMDFYIQCYIMHWGLKTPLIAQFPDAGYTLAI